MFRFVLVFFIFCFSVIQINAQAVDSVFHSPVPITSIELIKNDPCKIYISNTGAAIVSKSTDFGETWIAVTFDFMPSGSYGVSFNQLDTLVGYMAGGSYLYKTLDAGATWFRTQHEQIYIVDVNPYFPNIIFIQKAGDSGFGPFSIFRSIDSGQTWSETSLELFILDTQFHPTKDSVAYGFNNHSVLLKTTNSGKTWEIIKKTSTQITAVSLNTINPEILYVATNGFLYKVTDDGINWHNISTSLKALIPSFKIRSILLDDSISGRFYIGLDEGLYLTEDDGLHWKKIYNAPVDLIEADNSTPRNIYFTTNYGKTVLRFVDTLRVTNIYDENAGHPEQYSLSQNFPNPFNPQTTIHYSLARAGKVTLKIYDIHGKQVATLVDKPQTSGFYTVIFNGRKLASGLYFYRLMQNGHSLHRKMLLVK